MQTKMNTLFLTSTLLITLIAPASVTANKEKGSAHHNFPPAVDGFHDVMAPLWHSASGEKRAEQTCKQVCSLTTELVKIYAEGTPKEVNNDEWNLAVNQLQQHMLTIKSACDNKESSEKALTGLHDAFYGLVQLVGHKH